MDPLKNYMVFKYDEENDEVITNLVSMFGKEFLYVDPLFEGGNLFCCIDKSLLIKVKHCQHYYNFDISNTKTIYIKENNKNFFVINYYKKTNKVKHLCFNKKLKVNNLKR